VQAAEEFYTSITTMKTAMRYHNQPWEAGTPGVPMGSASPLRYDVWFPAVCELYRSGDLHAAGNISETVELDLPDGISPEDLSDVQAAEVATAFEQAGKEVHKWMRRADMFQAAFDMVHGELPDDVAEIVSNVGPLPGDTKLPAKGEVPPYAAWFSIIAKCMRGEQLRDIGHEHGLSKQQVSNIRKSSIRAGLWEAAQEYVARATEQADLT
jgi:hypothetical protein